MNDTTKRLSEDELAALCKALAQRANEEPSTLPLDAKFAIEALQSERGELKRYERMALYITDFCNEHDLGHCTTEVELCQHIEWLTTNRDRLQAQVERLQTAALPFARCKTLADYTDEHGRTWRCQVTAEDIAELRETLADTTPADVEERGDG